MLHLVEGDCRELAPFFGPFDLIIADPPYMDTSLSWDRAVEGWLAVALEQLKPTGSMWLFGSMRYLLGQGVPTGFRYAQDLVWEKPNGSGLSADRFRRVHEHVLHLYRDDTKWGDVYNAVQRVPSGLPKKTPWTRSTDVTHIKPSGPSTYVDDGLRLPRSVMKIAPPRNGLHPTQKPVDLLEQLIVNSCPPDGLVGDFFAGSGAVGEACRNTGRRYVGFETSAKYAAVALQRLSE